MVKRKSRKGKRAQTARPPDESADSEPKATPPAERPVAETVGASLPTSFSVGDMIAGKYELVAQVGVGSFGQVYQAFRVDLPDHLLAIKILPLDANSSELIRHELTALAAVTHPNIVQLSDHGVEATFAWYTMPWYDSITLQQQLNRRSGKGLTLEEAHRIFLPVAEALVALHEAGFRHQDIKPDNILLAQFSGARERHPLVIDLGLATQHTGQRLGGTPEFMSPEQAQSLGGDAVDIDDRSDTYSLAATLLYTLLDEETRGRLFPKALAEATPEQVLVQVMNRASELSSPRLAWLAPLPLVVRRPLCRALRDWLSLTPSARPDAKQFTAALELLGLPERFYRRVRRGALTVVCLIALLVPASWVTGSFLDDMSALKERANELLGRQRKLAGQQRVLQTQKALLGNEIAELQRAKEELESELVNLQTRASDQKKKSRNLLNDARYAMKHMKQELARLEKDKLSLSERGDSAKAEATRLATEVSEQRAEQGRLSNQLDALNQVLKDATSRTQLYDAELKASKQQQAALRGRLTQLEEELRAARAARVQTAQPALPSR